MTRQSQERVPLSRAQDLCLDFLDLYSNLTSVLRSAEHMHHLSKHEGRPVGGRVFLLWGTGGRGDASVMDSEGL